MFKKEKLSFANKEVFGDFKITVNGCFCMIAKMTVDNKIYKDGTINPSIANKLKLEELWSYIYHLYYHNYGTNEVFSQMRRKNITLRVKGSAHLFYLTVKEFLGMKEDPSAVIKDKISKIDLILFINNVVEKYKGNLVNPVFDYIKMNTGDSNELFNSTSPYVVNERFGTLKLRF